MSYEETRSAYQAATAGGATQSALIQLVYTHLAQDLFRAADAVRRGSVEARCAASKHALLLLGHLESWADEGAEPALAASLREFYAMLRTSVITQQQRLEASVLEQCAKVVLETRAAWQQKEALVVSSTMSNPPSQSSTSGHLSFHA